MKSAKSEALNRKKEMEETSNVCKSCGKREGHRVHKDKEHEDYHSFKSHGKKEEKVEKEVEKEEEEE